MVIDKYLAYINQANFTLAASLFAQSGILAPAFEPQLVGRKAIYRYLVERSMQGIYVESMPRQLQQFPNSRSQIDVAGTFSADAFTLKTNLTFLLNQSQEIYLLQIKLMMPLKELESLSFGTELLFDLQQYTPSYANGETYLKVVVHNSLGILAFI